MYSCQMGHLGCVGHLVSFTHVVISGSCGSSGRKISVVPQCHVDLRYAAPHNPVTY